MSRLPSSIRAEFIKERHASPARIALIAPLPFCLFGMLASGAFSGTGGAGDAGFATYGWNWWYVLMLQVSTALVCASVANIDARQNLRPVLGLPLPLEDAWWAKTVYALAVVLGSNLVVFVFACISGLLGGTSPNFFESLATMFIVTLAVSWMVPVGLFLTMRFGTLAGIALPILIQFGVGISTMASAVWWLFPMSVAARATSPFTHVAPSGILLDMSDPMGIIDWRWFAALAIVLALFMLLSVLGAHWFSRREAA